MPIIKKALLISTFTTLFLFWFLPISIASSKWVNVAKDKNGYKYSYDNSTIKKVGDNITYDQMIIFSKPQYGMTGGTSQLKANCRIRVATEDKHAMISNGQSRPYNMTPKGVKIYLGEDTELGKVLTAVCQSRK